MHPAPSHWRVEKISERHIQKGFFAEPSPRWGGNRPAQAWECVSGFQIFPSGLAAHSTNSWVGTAGVGGGQAIRVVKDLNFPSTSVEATERVALMVAPHRAPSVPPNLPPSWYAGTTLTRHHNNAPRTANLHRLCGCEIVAGEVMRGGQWQLCRVSRAMTSEQVN